MGLNSTGLAAESANKKHKKQVMMVRNSQKFRIHGVKLKSVPQTAKGRN